jgi:hypothetical protein
MHQACSPDKESRRARSAADARRDQSRVGEGNVGLSRPRSDSFIQWLEPNDLFFFVGKRRRRLGQRPPRMLLAWYFDKVIIAHGDLLIDNV